jgi:formate/nitrite transporter FocA (FNT family)
LAHCFAGAFVAPFGIYPFLATDLVVKQENMSKPRLNDMVIFMAGVLLGNIVGGLLSFIIWGWH